MYRNLKCNESLMLKLEKGRDKERQVGLGVLDKFNILNPQGEEVETYKFSYNS